MAPDSAVTSGSADHEVMAAVDGDRIVIADIAVDDAWLSMSAADAPTLAELR